MQKLLFTDDIVNILQIKDKHCINALFRSGLFEWFKIGNRRVVRESVFDDFLVSMDGKSLSLSPNSVKITDNKTGNIIFNEEV